MFVHHVILDLWIWLVLCGSSAAVSYVARKELLQCRGATLCMNDPEP